VALLGLLLQLVTGPGATGRSDGATDDRARRSGHGATEGRAGRAAPQRTGSGTGLIVALGRLSGDRPSDGADAATDHGADRSADDRADGRATKGAGTGAKGLGTTLLVLRGGTGPGRSVRIEPATFHRIGRIRDAVALVEQVVVVRMRVPGQGVVLVVHWGPPCGVPVHGVDDVA
jgi:hypothetical protein